MNIRVFSILALSFSTLASAGAHDKHGEVPSAQAATESMFHFESEWKDQDSATFKLESLQGKPAVVSMLYTHCESACPLTISDMSRIQDGLSEKARKETRFVVFSLDSKRDTPARLKETAKKHKVDLSTWKFVTADSDAVRELAAALGVKYKELKNGEYSHTNLISVLDAKGIIVHRQEGLKKDPKATIQTVNAFFK